MSVENNVRQMITKACKVAAVWILCTVFTIFLENLGIRIENLLLVYMVGVLISIVETSSMMWGIGIGLGFVLTFNFLFTTPRYTFAVDDPNYIISLLIFVVVALIVATLTEKLQKQMRIATRKTEMLAILNEIGSGFLNLTGYGEIEAYSSQSLYTLTGRKADVYIRRNKKDKFDDSLAEWCYQNTMSCGYGQKQFRDKPRFYLPLSSGSRTYGVISLDCSEGDFVQEEMMYINTVIAQLTLVLERERLYEEKEKSRVQVEKERLKSTLLRSISHDLRTPLTGIAGNAGFLVENLEELEKDTAKDMLRDISKDAEWLNGLVENLLNMTRIQDGRLEIHKTMEVVDDIVSAAISLVEKRKENHSLITDTPQEILLLPVDARLFTQVLVNLMDNAFRHSGKNTTVTVKVRGVDGMICFWVEDNGKGIPADKMDQVFDSFFTTAGQASDKQRGTGLGLSICKSIVEAHQGTITVYVNESGGASFKVEMPAKEVQDE